MEKIKQLRRKLEELYLKEGLTDRVLELSRELDKEIIKIQLKQLDKSKDENCIKHHKTCPLLTTIFIVITLFIIYYENLNMKELRLYLKIKNKEVII